MAAAFSSACLGSGCGSGTIAIASGGGDDGGGNGAATISAFRIENGAAPPAEIRFVLSDPESDPVAAELFLSVDGGPPEPLHALPVPNPNTFATAPDGVEHTLEWHFDDEELLPDDAGFEPDVLVYAVIAGGGGSIVPGSNAIHGGIGNDAPTASTSLAAGQEVSAIVAVPIALADTSSDLVSVRIEFDVAGDVPDTGWRLARPAIADETPPLAIDGVIAPAGGTIVGFFWDTNFDLFELERDVRLRITPIDPTVPGASFVTPIFRVDNNEAPLSEIRQEILLLSPDQRRGIPVPCVVRDRESDEIDLVFQWRRPGESFPLLPSDPLAVGAILADPALRKEYRVCTPFPTASIGHVSPIGASSLRMSEIAPRVDTHFDGELAGAEIEILRASVHPAPVASSWTENPLERPISALPIGDGRRALVLDASGAAGWRLLEIELATGAIVRTIATSDAAVPTALATEYGKRSVLVASEIGGAWRVERVVLASGERTELIAAEEGSLDGSLRGIASAGTHAALATASDVVLRLDWSDSEAPRRIRLFEGLATPWGIAIDPLDANRAYVAERDANLGRVVAIRLDDRSVRPIAANHAVDPPLPRPEALAIARGGARLYTITRPPGGTVRELRSVELGALGENHVTIHPHAFDGQVGSIATGPDGLCVVALSTSSDLAVGGGVEQRRTIVSYDRALQVATVDAAFVPPLSPLSRWRVEHPTSSVRSSPEGHSSSFVWDSSEVVGAGPVFLKLSPFDSELGITDETGAAKVLEASIDGRVSHVGDPASDDDPHMASPADIDADGDIDLAVACPIANRAAVHYQTSRDEFEETPVALGSSVVTAFPSCVAPADLDADGDIDLAISSWQSDRVTIYFQIEDGAFAHTPQFVVDGAVSGGPGWVVAADLDADGDQDLVTANSSSSQGWLAVFRQDRVGSFATAQILAGTLMPGRVDTGDFDGDGDLDLVATIFGNGAPPLALFFQTAPGVFHSVAQTIDLPPFPGSLGGARGVTASDLDGDGDLDLAVTRDFSNAVWVVFQVAPGVFDGTNAMTLTDPRVASPVGVIARDFDADGDQDIACSNFGSHNVAVFHQTSPGAFAEPPGISASDVFPPQNGFLSSADFDGDGDLDLLTSEPASDALHEELTILERTGPGDFVTPSLVLPVPGDGVRGLALCDLDRDGDLDIVVPSEDERVHRFHQSAPGVFESAPESIDVSAVIDGMPLAAAADFDGDGDVDLAVGGHQSDVLALYLQDETGEFSAPPVMLGPAFGMSGLREIVAADLDGDGDTDLVAASAKTSLVHLFFQRSAGAFDPVPTILPGNGGASGVDVADLDADGDLDIVVSRPNIHRLSIYRQTEPSVFVPSGVVGNAQISNVADGVVAVDLDGDGDRDLATSHLTPNGRCSLRVFFQNPRGTFTNAESIEVAPVIGRDEGGVFLLQSVQAGDVDGDGDNDLIAGGGSPQLSVFLQVAPGRFASRLRTYTEAQGGGGDIVVGDVDGDGDVDLTFSRLADVPAISILWGAH